MQGYVSLVVSPLSSPRLVLAGGMTQEPYYRECLAEAFLRHLPRWRVVRPERRPVEGAIAMAQKAG